MRAVLDTSILVRAMLNRHGSVAPVLGRLTEAHYISLYSTETMAELAGVLRRPRMSGKYGVTEHDIRALFRLLTRRGEQVKPLQRARVCRDPKDDKFLELALAGHADVVVTGDEDLLVLHPFEGIPIVQPYEFLRMLPPVPGTESRSTPGSS